jgi:hypothetical protein
MTHLAPDFPRFRTGLLLAIAAAAGAAAAAQAPTAAGIERLLAELDQAWARGDAAGFARRFEPDHAGAHAQLLHRLQRAFATGCPQVRTSRLVGPPQTYGERTVVRVRSEIRAADGRSRQVVVDDCLLAVRAGKDGAVVPTLAVEVPAETPNLPGDRLQCPACNYEIGGVPGWLAVPQRSDRAQAVEAATFHLVGTDLSCDVTVRIADCTGDPAAPPANATTVAEQLAAVLRQFEPTARAGLATAWSPPVASTADAAGTALAGARIAVELPADTTHRDGSRAVFHVVTLGPLQHLLLVRGSLGAFTRHERALQALLASYRVLDVDVDAALAAARPLQHHTGGELRGDPAAGVAYHNSRWELELTGPVGWRAAQRCGGSLFRVVWSGPDGGRLWLHGYAVPAGMQNWCSETADLWFAELCAERGLVVVDDEPGASRPWSEAADCRARSRYLTCTEKDPLRPTRTRLLRLVVRDDLFVVVDAAPATAAEEAPLRAALAALRLP